MGNLTTRYFDLFDSDRFCFMRLEIMIKRKGAQIIEYYNKNQKSPNEIQYYIEKYLSVSPCSMYIIFAPFSITRYSIGEQQEEKRIIQPSHACSTIYLLTVLVLIARKPALGFLRVCRASGNNFTISQWLAVWIRVRVGPWPPSVSRCQRIPSEVVDVGICLPRRVFELDCRPQRTGTRDLQVVRQALESACAAVRADGAGRGGLDLVVLPVGENHVIEIVIAVALELHAALVEVGIHGVLKGVTVVVASKIVVRADFPAADGLGCHAELKAVRATT